MIAARVMPTTAGADLEEILFIARQRDPQTGALAKVAVRFSFDATGGSHLTISEPSEDLVEPIDGYRLKVLRANSRNTVYPYELTGLLGDFAEYDLDDGRRAGAGRPAEGPQQRGDRRGRGHHADRPATLEGVTRVVLLGDPTKSLGALSEPECRRIIAALDLAEEMRVPVEWYALSAGARISMDSGTENMDWVARALKRIVTFTQDGGEINIVVAGIAVGAQPYWNAEATMLMHTTGILVMTPDSAMVLTGKQSLDFSGGVSAEDNFGIGGYDRVMGPNGQAQYWAAEPDLRPGRGDGALRPHLRRPRRGASAPRHHERPGRPGHLELPAHVAGQRLHHRRRDLLPGDQPGPQEGLRHPNGDARRGRPGPPGAGALGGHGRRGHRGGAGRCISAESRCACWASSRARCRAAVSRPPTGRTPTPPARFSRARRRKPRGRSTRPAATGRWWCWRTSPGFDGSPESMRKLQLEYGAEIGRAIVNFRGPIVFCVISRYHGGAFVVFSKALNPNMTVLALEGSFASVLGGAPAAAVVFTADVNARTANDPADP